LITPAHISTEANGAGVYTDYNLHSARKMSDSIEETLYGASPGEFVTSTHVVYYGSRFHHQPTSKITYSSLNERLETRYTYAFDLLPSTCTNINDGLANYLNAIHQDSLIYYDSLVHCDPQLPLATTCRYPQHVQFRRELCLDRLAFLNARLASVSGVNGYVFAHQSAKDSADAIYKPILELQDQHMNSLVETSSFNNNQLTGASYTQYAFSSNPSGKIYPSLTKKLEVATLSTTFTPLSMSSNNQSLIKDNRYTDDANFQFAGGNLIELTKRDGVTESYIWDPAHGVPIVKAIGVPYTTLRSAYNTVSGNLVTLRSQQSLGNALLFTYTYTPLIGLSSETNQIFQKTSYEYDRLFRLKLVRDKDNNILKKYEYQYRTSQP
jgi:hypothetical protein